jgi:general secretion pathway protein B
MSYILDALKKADAQRERDPARGIHAHPAPVGPARVRDAGSPWLWAAAAVVVAIVGGGAWALLQDRGAVVPAPVVASATAPAVVTPPVPAPAPAPLASAPVTSAPVTSAPANEPAAAVVLPPPEPPRAVARVEPEEEPAGSVRHRPRARVPAPPTAATPTAAASGAAPPVPSAVAPAHTVAATAPTATTPPPPEAVATGLPADAPKLAVTGGVYSANRAQRMLIVNGQVVNEGADLGGGVVLEEIKPKSAVLRFRGGRYSVAF